MQLVVPGAICITARSLVKDTKLLQFLIEWTVNSPKLNLQKEWKHMWWEYLNRYTGWVCLCRTILPGWPCLFWEGVHCVSSTCRVGWDWGLFILNLCMPGAPLRRALKLTALFCSKNARASGHTDMWEGRAVTENTRWSWVTPGQGNHLKRGGICRQKESEKL